MKKTATGPDGVSEEAADSSNAGRVSLYGATVEYGIHCMLWLIAPREKPVSSRDLAELQGVPSTLMARVMPRLEKAGLVVSTSGISGGYRLAKAPQDITVLDVIDAIDGRKSVFDCKDVRKNCALFGGNAPAWITNGVCGVHAVMLRAEKSMRNEMSRTTLQDLAIGFSTLAPADFGDNVGRWLDDRATNRELARISAVKDSSRNRRRGSDD